MNLFVEMDGMMPRRNGERESRSPFSFHNTFVHTGLKKHQPGFFFRGDWDDPRDPGISSSMSFTADGK